MSENPEELRRRFYANPTVNPRTGAKIQVGKKTYNDLVKEFGQPSGAGQVSPGAAGTAGFVPGMGFFAQGMAPIGRGAPLGTFPGLPGVGPTYVPGPAPTFSPGFNPATQMLQPPGRGFASAPSPLAGFPSQLPPGGFAPSPQAGLPSQLPPGGFAPFMMPTAAAAPTGFPSFITPIPTMGGLTAQRVVSPAVPVTTVLPPINVPSVLVVVHRSDDNEYYVIPHDVENKELIEDLLTVDGTVQYAPGLTEEQRDVYELLDTNLESFYYDGPLRGVNIGTVIRLSEGTGEAPGEGGYVSPSEEEEGELSED